MAETGFKQPRQQIVDATLPTGQPDSAFKVFLGAPPAGRLVLFTKGTDAGGVIRAVIANGMPDLTVPLQPTQIFSIQKPPLVFSRTLNVTGIPSGETWGRAVLNRVYGQGILSALAFGVTTLVQQLLGGAPATPNDLAIRDDELYTCWPGDDLPYDMTADSDDGPVYHVDVSTD